MKKFFKKFVWLFPVLALPIGLSVVLTACGANADKVSQYSLISNDVKNKQTELLNNLTVSMRQIDNEITTATGFVFDQQVNSKSNLSTFYVMTNFHFYMSAFNNSKDYQNPNSVSLSLGDANIGSKVSNWNYLVNDFDFRLANTNPQNQGDVYLINNEYGNYDAVVYAIQVDLLNKNLPKAFKYFNDNKTKLNFKTTSLNKSNIKETIITSGGYPKVNNQFYWNQYSLNNFGTAILMDPYLVNYPLVGDKRFNNEIIYPVQGMTMNHGASGSLVLDNIDNSLSGIYFGFLGSNEQSYGMYIPFVAYEEYLQFSFNDTNGNEWYFDVVNTNPNLVQIQTQTWLPSNITNYQSNNYTNLVDATIYNGKINNQSNKHDVLNVLSQNENVKITIVRNTNNNSDNKFLTQKPIKVSELASELLKHEDKVQMNLIENKQNLFKSWIDFAFSNLNIKTFLMTKDIANLK